eukprot:7377349-Prymnesium_polylepis.1
MCIRDRPRRARAWAAQAGRARRLKSSESGCGCGTPIYTGERAGRGAARAVRPGGARAWPLRGAFDGAARAVHRVECRAVGEHLAPRLEQ